MFDIFHFEKKKKPSIEKEKTNSRELSLTSLSTNVDHWISRLDAIISRC